MSKLAEEIKSKLNIVDYIRQDGLELKAESSNRYTCHCPFHQEKTPSFKVNEDFQNFKCFGCGESGDVIAYHAKRHLISYSEAMLSLANTLGIDTEDNFKDTQKYFEIASFLGSMFEEEFLKLPDTHIAKQEVIKRNLKPEHYGYAPNNKNILNRLLEKFPKSDLQELGYITEKGNLLWVDRLMFIIRDYMGKTIGFTGRRLDGQDSYKYVNSKSSVIYDKQKSLYNIDKAKKSIKEKDFVFMVEGTFDVDAMVAHNYANTVSSNGTSITKYHLSTITKCLSTKGKIILVLDGDGAGQKSMLKIFKEYKDIQKILYVITLPKESDPCSYLQENSKLPRPVLFLDLLYERITNKDFNTVEDKIQLEKDLKEFLSWIGDDYIKQEYRNKALPLIKINIQDTQEHSEYSIDDYFCKSLALVFAEPKIGLNKEDYPVRYHEFIEEYLKNPLEITNLRLLEKVQSFNVSTESELEVLISYYKSILKVANKKEKQRNTAKMLENKNFKETLSVLSEVKNV